MITTESSFNFFECKKRSLIRKQCCMFKGFSKLFRDLYVKNKSLLYNE